MNTPELVVSAVPHTHSGNTLQKMMRQILLALIPALLIGVAYFGFGVVQVAVIAVVSAVVWQALLQKLMHKPVVFGNMTTIVAAVLLAMIVPPGLPWWTMCVGTLIMVLLGTEIYGGYGNNPFNGVLIAWVVLQISFPEAMTAWAYPPGELLTIQPPLQVLQEDGVFFVKEFFSLSDLLVGRTVGYAGQTSALFLLLGGLFLLYRRVITWHIPVSFLAGVAAFAGLFWLLDAEAYASPVVHILAGGTMITAFFLATDYPSSPVTRAGMLLYGFGAGMLTVVIRIWGQWPDGAFFAVFLLSILTPLLDKIAPRVYGR